MTRRITSPFIVLLAGTLVVCACLPSARAQTAEDVLRFSLRTPGASARALGFGGGSAAGWADLSALTANPAGLGYYTGSEVAGGLNMTLADDASTFQASSDAASFSQNDQTTSTRLGSFVGVYDVPTRQGSFVLGFGYTQKQTFTRRLSYGGENGSSSITDKFLPTNNEYAVDSLGVYFPDDVPSNIVPFIAYQGGAIEFFQGDYDNGNYPFEQAALFLPIRQSGTVQRDGEMSEINFAGALEVAKDVMLGVSANLTTGRYLFEHELVETDQGENEGYEVLRNGTFYRGLEEMMFREQFESEFTGFNMRVGVSAAVSPSLRFGFTAETPTWTSVTDDYTQAVIRTNFSEGGTLAYGDDPNENVGKGTFDYRITTPWRLGSGLAFVQDGLRIAASAEFVDWSNLSLDSNSFDFPRANDKIEDDFRYVFNWHGGVEYRLKSGPTVRLGMARRPDPREYDLTFADGETYDRSRTFFSAGVSYPFSERMTLDVGWMREQYEDQFIPYALTDEGTPFEDADEIPTPIVDEKVIRNHLQIGVRYQF